jgi:hypothetical protein
MKSPIRMTCFLLAGAMLWLGWNATPAQAGWLGFRNDLAHPVILQATDLGKASKPLYLQPGESTCDWVNDRVVRKITVLDGRDRRTELVRFEAAAEQGDYLYLIRSTIRDGKRVIEAAKTIDTGRKRK